MRTSVKITKEAKNNTFDECKIYGGVENAGQSTLFKKTFIGLNKKIEEHPVVYGIVATIVGGVLLFFITKFLEKIY